MPARIRGKAPRRCCIAGASRVHWGQGVCFPKQDALR